MKLQSMSALLETLWIFGNFSSIAQWDTSLLAEESKLSFWRKVLLYLEISLLPFSEPLVVLSHFFVCLFIFRQGNHTYPGVGVVQNDIFCFVLCSSSYGSVTAFLLLFELLSVLSLCFCELLITASVLTDLYWLTTGFVLSEITSHSLYVKALYIIHKFCESVYASTTPSSCLYSCIAIWQHL